MEDILEVYRRPYDPLFPVVCMDESTKQLLDEIRLPLPGRPGTPELYDCEYRRNGVATLFLAFEPLAGWRQVEVTEQRTRRDWAYFIRNLLDEHYPASKRVILVMDNLNSHSGASLYETFAPAEALRLLNRLAACGGIRPGGRRGHGLKVRGDLVRLGLFSEEMCQCRWESDRGPDKSSCGWKPSPWLADQGILSTVA